MLATRPLTILLTSNGLTFLLIVVGRSGASPVLLSSRAAVISKSQVLFGGIELTEEVTVDHVEKASSAARERIDPGRAHEKR